MPSCFQSGPQELAHLEQTTGQRDAVKTIAPNTPDYPLSVINSTQNSPSMKGKGEKGLIPSSVPHRWIKKCAFTLGVGCHYLIHLYD